MSASAEFMSYAIPIRPPQHVFRDEAVSSPVPPHIDFAFGSDPQTAADEMLAACKPGATIRLDAPVPGGFLARIHELIDRYMPESQTVSGPRFVGTRESLNALFEHQAIAMGAFDCSAKLRFPSAEHWLAKWQSSYGPLQRAYRLVDPEWRGQMTEDLVRLARRFSEADADGPYIRYDYLEFLVHKGPQQ